MALALYRKYRPRTFAEVIGQEHVTEPLAQALRTGRLHHAYLFSGPRGCGKTSSARILARSLNCEKGPTPEPCGTCDSCVALAPDGSGSIDVIEIDAASHGGVDDARDLRERAFFAPVSSRFKVYVIDEAHMVSPAGFNALLKLVEEPPEYVKFVFATTEPEKVLGTIKSRTHHYPFRLIPPGVLRPYLEQLCQSEGVQVEPPVFPLVVRAGGGSVRDSLSVLDQLIAGAGAGGVTYARAVALLGVTDAALLDEMCDALAATDGATAYTTIDRVLEAGHDPRRFAGDLLERLRDLIVLQQVPDAVAKGLLDCPQDQLERMTAQASRLGPATLTRCAGIVHDGLTEMRGTTAPRLLLELITARMLLPGADESTGALLQRMERLERRLGASTAVAQEDQEVRPPPPPPSQDIGGGAARKPIPAAPAPAAVTAPPSTPAASAGPPSTMDSGPGTLDAAAIRRVWDEVLASIRRKSQRAWAVVREATVRDVDGDTLVLIFQHSVHADMLAANSKVLTDAVTQIVGGTWQVRCELSGHGPGGNRSTTPAAAAPPVPAPPATRPQTNPPTRPQATDRAPAPRTPPGDDEDWPTAAVPGGAAGAAAVSPVQAAPGARPSAVASATPSRPAADPRPGIAAARSAAAAARPTSPASARPAAARPTSPAPVRSAAPASAASAGPVAPASVLPATDAPDQARPSSPASGRPTAVGWDEEPPYDPDYDTAGTDPTYPGFDPGDEPADEEPPAVRESSEEQAIRLLREHLGAEPIA